MQINGLLALEITTPDFYTVQTWLKNNLKYNWRLFEFFSLWGQKQTKAEVLLNLNGGLPLVLSQSLAAAEMWYNDLVIGDLGVLAFKVKVPNMKHFYLNLKKDKVPTFSKLLNSFENEPLVWLKDPLGNNFIFTQPKNVSFYQQTETVGGIYGVVLGVKNIDKAVDQLMKFGYRVKYETTYKEDLRPLDVLNEPIKRVVMTNISKDFYFFPFIGPTEIDLVSIQVRVNSKVSPFKLIFQLTQTHNITQDLQLLAHDTNQYSILYTQVHDPDNQQQYLLVDLHRLRLRNIWDWDVKKAERKKEKFALKFVLNNALEKI